MGSARDEGGPWAGWRKAVKFNSNTEDREKHHQRQSVPMPGKPPFQGGT